MPVTREDLVKVQGSIPPTAEIDRQLIWHTSKKVRDREGLCFAVDL